MDGFQFNPFLTWQDQANKAPGAVAQKWANYIAMGSKWYFGLSWTKDEVEALAKVLAKVIANRQKIIVDQRSLVE